MPFKPLTSTKTALKSTDPEAKAREASLKPQTLDEIIATTEERIKIIYDDSGSMGSRVLVTDSVTGLIKDNGSRIELASAGTTDYMKNCKPHVTAIEITPLNAETLAMTKNLPLLATNLKAISKSGGTPLFGAMRRMATQHFKSKFTRALIFTDGEAGDSYSEDVPQVLQACLNMKIPIDFIIIGDKLESQLSANEGQLKQMNERSGGTFMICKDGESFRKKMKYFAPMLRHMLPAIASQEER